MSLDVYLTLEGVFGGADGSIPVRENGEIRCLTRAEWDEKFPGLEPITLSREDVDHEVFSANITHNLNKMAAEAGIYRHLWRPDEIGVTHARQLIEPLMAGLALLESDAPRFEAFNPKNGWGDYGGLVRFVSKYLAACKKYPDATVSVWR